MQVRTKWLYAVLTAIMFPVVLLGTRFALAGLADHQWYRGWQVKISSAAAVETARTKCQVFAYYPVLKDRRAPWHTMLNSDDQWVVSYDGTKWYDFWTRPTFGASAIVDAQSGRVLQCSVWVV